jgi:hypothetical protein
MQNADLDFAEGDESNFRTENLFLKVFRNSFCSEKKKTLRRFFLKSNFCSDF